jgi:hypothetical protein
MDDPRYVAQSRGRSNRGTFPIPEANEQWMPQARSWYNSLRLSGQSEFFEASDWATAICAAQAYDIFLRTYNAAIFASFVRLSERLGACILDRKRGRVELEDPEPQDADEDAADEAVQGWQRRLSVVPGGKARLWQAGPERSLGRPEASLEPGTLPRLRQRQGQECR